MFPRKHHSETPIERIFHQVTGRKMNRMEKRYFLRKRRPKTQSQLKTNCTSLTAPRAKAQTDAAVFALLGQKKRARPQRLGWWNSLRKFFGVDLLIDSRG